MITGKLYGQHVHCTTDANCTGVTCDTAGQQAECHQSECLCHQHVNCTTDANCTGVTCDTVGQQAECREFECLCHPYVTCSTDAHCTGVICDTEGHQALCHDKECHCHTPPHVEEECEHASQCTHCGANATCDEHFCHGMT
ncbi:hypothetical protein MAR_012673 [Mya arenaria]|uniref:Uncharacterized protein n=1 Tax=Mya arenaria TaxID=6604 RepID=A0ABY7G0D9_MYAAR|nr:hypothetical protein MAR_012673 [Mya arenaria]